MEDDDDETMTVGVAATMTTAEYEEEVVKRFKHVKPNDSGELVSVAPGIVVRAKARLALELAKESVKLPTPIAPGLLQVQEQLSRVANTL